MAIQIFIEGVDYTDDVDFASVSIPSNITANNDTAQFDVNIFRPSGIPVKARPKGLQEVQIQNGTDDEGNPLYEFGGVIAGVTENVPESADTMSYTVTAKDYSLWFSKHLVTETYPNVRVPNSTIENIATDIVTHFVNISGADFDTSGIQATGITLSKKFDHQDPYGAMQDLANYVGWWFYIDYYKVVHLEPILTNVSPLPNNQLLVDTDTQSYSDLEFEEDVTQLRNQVYLYGFSIPLDDPYTDHFTGDGTATSFTTTFELIHALGNIAIYVNGAKATNTLDMGQTLTGSSYDGNVYINYKQKTLRFNVALSAGDTVSCTYQPMIGTSRMYNNPLSITEIKLRDGLDGVYEFAENNVNLSSADASLANLEGRRQLLQYNNPHYIGSMNSFLQGWRPGQYFSLTSNYRMDGEFQNMEFYVLKVTKSIVTHPHNGSPVFFHKISIADSPYNY